MNIIKNIEWSCEHGVDVTDPIQYNKQIDKTAYPTYEDALRYQEENASLMPIESLNFLGKRNLLDSILAGNYTIEGNTLQVENCSFEFGEIEACGVTPNWGQYGVPLQMSLSVFSSQELHDVIATTISNNDFYSVGSVTLEIPAERFVAALEDDYKTTFVADYNCEEMSNIVLAIEDQELQADLLLTWHEVYESNFSVNVDSSMSLPRNDGSHTVTEGTICCVDGDYPFVYDMTAGQAVFDEKEFAFAPVDVADAIKCASEDYVNDQVYKEQRITAALDAAFAKGQSTGIKNEEVSL